MPRKEKPELYLGEVVYLDDHERQADAVFHLLERIAARERTSVDQLLRSLENERQPAQ